MNMINWLRCMLFLVILTSCQWHPLPYATHLPIATLTPGNTLNVTVREICISGYSHRIRDVPASVKRRVFIRYAITSHPPGSYEVDHLISLQLGGSNDIHNLWPQPYQGEWNAHVKDGLENRLHNLVCKGQLSLLSAQWQIATDWIAAYQKYYTN